MKQRILWSSLVLLLVGGTRYFYSRTSHIDKRYLPRQYITRMLALGRPFVDFLLKNDVVTASTFGGQKSGSLT